MITTILSCSTSLISGSLGLINKWVCVIIVHIEVTDGLCRQRNGLIINPRCSTPAMSVYELLKVCDEPDLREYDGEDYLEALWCRAKTEFGLMKDL
jgi:hypothetical protein